MSKLHTFGVSPAWVTSRVYFFENTHLFKMSTKYTHTLPGAGAVQNACISKIDTKIHTMYVKYRLFVPGLHQAAAACILGSLFQNTHPRSRGKKIIHTLKNVPKCTHLSPGADGAAKVCIPGVFFQLCN